MDWESDSPKLRAKLRMAQLPTDKQRDQDKQFLFPCEDQGMWVPVAVVNGNVHILPGVPSICKPEYQPSAAHSPFRICLLVTPLFLTLCP